MTNHAGNTTNGNALSGISNGLGHSLRGRMTQLPIYEVSYSVLAGSPLSGGNFATVVKSIDRDDGKDLVKGYRQPTNHDDRLGNLPDAPGGRSVYREYFLPGNGFAWSGFVRLVANLQTRRLFITPTHYDVYLINAAAAGRAPQAQLIAPNTAQAHNPFYLISGVGAYNDGFL